MKGHICQEMAALLPVYADGELPAGERAAVEEHLADCADCTLEASRIRENFAYLHEILTPLRMPHDFDPSFLLALPRKSGRAPAPAKAAPRTVVLGGVRRRRSKKPFLLGGAVVLAAVMALWRPWESSGPVRRDPGPRPAVPEPGPRPPRGEGPADPKPAGGTGDTPRTPAGGSTGAGRGDTPVPPGTIRNAADLVAAVRAARTGGYGPVVGKGWALLAGTPGEATAIRTAAEGESSPAAKAAFALVLGYDGSEDSKSLVRPFLSDADPEVRTGAVLGLARSLSFGAASKRQVPAGPPLGMAVETGAIEDAPGRAELAGLLASESDTTVRRILVQVLSASATDPEVRSKLLDGVGGAYGEELREPCLRALRGINDAAVVEGIASALSQPSFPAALRGAAITAMVEADGPAAATALATLLASEQDAGARVLLVENLARAGGAGAEGTLRQVATADTEAAVRNAAVRSLRGFPSADTVSFLERIAQDDSDQSVRQTAETVGANMARALEQAVQGE